MHRFSGILLLVVATVSPLHAETAKDEVNSVVRRTVDKVLGILKNKELSRDDKRERVMKAIEPVVDFPLIAKLVLGRKHWTAFSAEERDTFTKLLVETLKASYFEKLDLFTDEVVEFKEPEARRNKYYMLTSIVSKGDRIAVAYKLYKSKEGWKVYDFEIEGVSVVKSYGSQYDEFLRDGSPADLLERMRQKIAEAKEKQPEPKPDEPKPEPDPKPPAGAPSR